MPAGITYLLAATALVTSAAAFYFASAYLKVYKEIDKYKKANLKQDEIEKSLQEARNSAQKILSEANQKASEQLAESTQKATQIVNNANILTQQQQNQLQQSLTTLLSVQSKQLTDIFDKTKQDALSVVKSISQMVGQESTREIEGFRSQVNVQLNQISKTLEGVVGQTQETIGQHLDNYQKQIAKELDDYKKKRIMKVEENIYDILRDVSRQFMSKSINTQEHEEIIISALEDAKKKNLL